MLLFESLSQKSQHLAQIAETQCAKRAFKRPSHGPRDEVQGLLELLELCLCVCQLSPSPIPNGGQYRQIR